LHHLCSAILYEFFRASGLPDPNLPHGEAADTPAAVRRALDLIHQEFAALSGAREIAARVGLSPQHLSRLFHRHVGSTPVAYLWQVRTERAADLVTSSGLPLTRIAAQTGFRTQFHMSRRIHAAYGTSPQGLRRGRPQTS
jgi:transcriptional regulator GlxA family with amidase domain